jgi:hypothetical protein
MNEKKRLIKVFLTTLFFLGIMNTKAEDVNNNCSNEEKLRLKKIVNSIKVTYELKEYNSPEIGNFKAYQLNLIGFTNDIYIMSESNGILVTYDGDNTAIIEGMTPAVTYVLPFYAASNSTCNDTLIMTRSITIPPYNIYSDDPICVGYETYELCKKNSPIIIKSYSEFINRMNEYIKSLKNNSANDENNVITVPKEKPILERILDFIIDKIIFITVPIIVIGTSLIIYIEKKKRESIL